MKKEILSKYGTEVILYIEYGCKDQLSPYYIYVYNRYSTIMSNIWYSYDKKEIMSIVRRLKGMSSCDCEAFKNINLGEAVEKYLKSLELENTLI